MGVYLHWPYCARICPYCDFVVVRDRGRREEQRALVDAMAADLRAQAARLGPRRLVSVFLGGGTPSLMEPAWAAELIALARALWPATPGDPPMEVSLEANPTDAEAQRFGALAAAGVDRLSLGVQALDDAALAFLGRLHSAAEGRAALAVAARTFPRVSLDLIYARPGQTADAWAAELGEAIELGAAEHVSPYQLTVEPGTPFERSVRRGRWRAADPDLAADLYETTQAVLEGAGFEAYEVSNHARGEAARSRHNLLYWTGADYVGVGPAAHGRLTVAGARLATAAEPRITAYVRRVAETGVGHPAPERLTAQEAAQERLLMGLRTTDGAPLDALAPLELAPERLAGFAELGLLRLDGGRLRATAAGRPVLDRLTAELLTG